MRTKKGIITSAKMTGTVTVTVHRHAVHPKYRKRYRISKKFLADTNGHDNLIEGDMVLIGECAPLSKKKCFKVMEILKKAAEVSDLVEEQGVDKAIHREKQKPVAEKSDDKAEAAEASSTAAEEEKVEDASPDKES